MSSPQREEEMTVESSQDNASVHNDVHQAETTSLEESDADTAEPIMNEEERKKLHGGIDLEDEDKLSGEDYPKLFERYQERFYKGFSISQKLFAMERAQRDVMNFYYRRNHAILDALSDSMDEINDEILDETDKTRLQNILSMNSKLEGSLGGILNFNEQKIDKNKWLDLFVGESIPELIEDDLIDYEVNPQDVESWSHRHHPNMVISKFKPIRTKYSTHFSDLKELYSSSNTNSSSTKKRKLNDN